MKHFLLFATAIAFSGLSYAQITVNALDLNVGDVVLQANDISFQTDLSATGENLTWDFSSLNTDWIDTIAPIDPTTTTHASSFSNANLAIGTINLAAYFSYSSTGIANLGYGGYIDQLAQDAEIINTVADSLVIFPLNYADTRIGNAWGESTNLTVQGYTGKISNSIKRTQNCDAWGTVTTPEGTYNALRVQEETITIDSVFVIIEIPFIGSTAVPVDSLHQFDTTYVYKFYTNDTEIKLPLLEVEYEPTTNELISTKWIDFPDEVSINTIENSSLTIYPNPAKDVVYIQSEEAIINVNIYNLNGQLIKSEKSNKIHISDMPSALYIVEIETLNQITRQKLRIE